MELKSFDDLKGAVDGLTALIKQFVTLIKNFIASWKKEVTFPTAE